MGDTVQGGGISATAIEVVEACGEWFVRVVEDGHDGHTRSFELESYAMAYAEGQRLRLKLAEIVRL